MTGEPDAPGSPSLEALAGAVRELTLAAALTEISDEQQAAAISRLEEITASLRAASRPRIARELRLGKHDGLDGTRQVLLNRYNPAGPEMDVRIDGPGRVSAAARMSAVHQGPPGSVHGGISALLLDNVLGIAVQSAGYLCVTGTLSVRYLHRTPLDADLQLEAEVIGKEGRKVHTTASIVHDGTTTVTATGLFIEVATR